MRHRSSGRRKAVALSAEPQISWKSMDFLGFPRLSIDFPELTWISTDFLRKVVENWHVTVTHAGKP